MIPNHGPDSRLGLGVELESALVGAADSPLDSERSEQSGWSHGSVSCDSYRGNSCFSALRPIHESRLLHEGLFISRGGGHATTLQQSLRNILLPYRAIITFTTWLIQTTLSHSSPFAMARDGFNEIVERERFCQLGVRSGALARRSISGVPFAVMVRMMDCTLTASKRSTDVGSVIRPKEDV